MTDEEMNIVTFLQGSPESFFTRREIARKAVRRQVFEEKPHWVDSPLAALLARKVIEQNDHGHYRIGQDKPAK